MPPTAVNICARESDGAFRPHRRWLLRCAAAAADLSVTNDSPREIIKKGKKERKKRHDQH
jgi:hypothetical protein